MMPCICSKKPGFIDQPDAFLWVIKLVLFLASNFAESEAHLAAIQALSNHKKEYGRQLEGFQLYGSCSWRDQLKSGFWRPFSSQNKPILPSFASSRPPYSFL